MGRPRPDQSNGKKCSRCKELKPLTDFYPSKTTWDHLTPYCKPCQLHRTREWWAKQPQGRDQRAYQRNWREQKPRLAKDYSLQSRYGIPLGTYDRLFAEQNGQCAICGTKTPGGRGDFHIDHCHDTNVIRGLLCHGCNIGIGNLRHDEEILQRAINYLRQGPASKAAL